MFTVSCSSLRGNYATLGWSGWVSLGTLEGFEGWMFIMQAHLRPKERNVQSHRGMERAQWFLKHKGVLYRKRRGVWTRRRLGISRGPFLIAMQKPC